MSDDVRFGEGLWVSFAAAAKTVGVITLSEKLLARLNGQPLPADLVALRAEYRAGLARAAAAADAPTDGHVSGEEVLADAGLALDMSPSMAAKALGVSASGVRFACRAGHLGSKVGDRWLISRQELEVYKQTHLKRGVA
jgi:Helix-turn-helix domain